MKKYGKKLLCYILFVAVLISFSGFTNVSASATAPTKTIVNLSKDPIEITHQYDKTCTVIGKSSVSKLALKSSRAKLKKVKTKKTYVYITESGTKYHRAHCRYLWHSKIKITLKEAKEEGYSPCSICDPPN